MKKETKPLLKFQIISTVITMLALLILVVLVVKFYRAPGNSAYNFNQTINERNLQYSKSNSFGFTDKETAPVKPKGIFRIAVLGDSFIWGDGVPYDETWSHKLEKKILARYDSVEVLHWGRCGWSTLDEFNFFKQHGKDFGIGLLIIGWVDNDPDMGVYRQIAARDVAKEYPVLSKIMPSLARRRVNEEEQKDYDAWNDSIYNRANLKRYEALLADFGACLDSQKVRALVVMTPGPGSDTVNLQFAAVEPLIRRANFKCLNLFEPVRKKLKPYSLEKQQANPVNGHPGTIMTEEFAAEVMDYLEANHYLEHLPRQKTR